MLMRLLLCGGMAAARLLELAYSRRNIRDFGPYREGAASRRSFPMIVLLHTAVIAGTLLRGRRVRPAWVALLLAVQPLRAWVLLTLRHRWNARGAVSGAMDVATGGPYAYIRHPNYAVVAVELLALPMAFSLSRLALAATIANAGLLTLRIHDEERLLFAIPGYEEHFRHKPRFLPRL